MGMASDKDVYGRLDAEIKQYMNIYYLNVFIYLRFDDIMVRLDVVSCVLKNEGYKCT